MAKAKPTEKQLQWAECELGAIFHYDMTVYEQDYNFRKRWGYQPSLSLFNPDKLDTDQWIEAAARAGVKYAVLVTKHCTGFSLFPSEANEYHVGNTPYKKDIVKSFRESCEKYGVKPGVYYSCVCNAYENVDNPGLVRTKNPDDQKHYNKVLETQLTELWSRYGEWFEIWFDGGTLSVRDGGLDIKPLLMKYQPNAITFQGDKLKNYNNLRWVGNEEGVAPIDCYASTDELSQATGTEKNLTDGKGSRNGTEWKPAECDMPIRKRNEWFYIDNHDKRVMSAEALFDKYLKTVGRNTNLLLGIVIDRHGLVPEKDVKALSDFGKKINDSFSRPLEIKRDGAYLDFGDFKKVNTAVIKEDITDGHNVFGFVVEAHTKSGWKKVFSAEVIGHKRIARFRTVSADKLRLVITDGNENAQITELKAYYIKPSFIDNLLHKIK